MGSCGSIKMTELLKSLIRKFKILIKPNKIIKKKKKLLI
ncbi:hypothetical protein LEP1GSC021_0663 [Leptospira noguchii str. 1993005606]|nr:hypothetical protein LEP1GSC021_0663 [Leptospira noguchii str. 1993005606]